jgi:branched-chain amino acid transport system ATP-binding protein
VTVGTALELTDLSSGYAGTPAVRHLSLRVGNGEIVALLGPNGAGKTCTLLTISGLLKPLKGEIAFDGRTISGMRSDRIARLGIAHVPEDRSLFFGLTVLENLRLGGCRRRQDLEQVLDWFPPLRPLLTRRAGLLSGGEQQMLAVGRGMARRPRVLLIDELSLGLAPVIVTRLLSILENVVRETGTGMLLVEQQVSHALEISDRAYVLSHGDLVAEGPSSELAHRAALLESAYLGEAGIGS